MPLAVLAAGAAITLLLARGGLGRKRWQLALICLVLAADMLLGFREWRLPTAPYHVPDFYARLARDPARYGVVDLPAPQSDEDLGRILLDKLVHHKRVPYNLDRTAYVRGFDRPVYEEENLALRVAIPNTPRRYSEEARRFRCRLDCSWVRGLRRHGYRYLVLHRTGHRSLDHRLVRCLERCTTELVHRDDELRVYQAPTLPGAGGMR
jgi:hypothetical protein